MNRHVHNMLHQPLAVGSIRSALGRVDVPELCGTSVGVDSFLEKVLNEEGLVRDSNGEQPERLCLNQNLPEASFSNLVAWNHDTSFGEGVNSIL